MTKLEEAVQAITGLSAQDRAELLQVVFRDLANPLEGVESNPQVCGGEACIVRTRIPVWLLVQARFLGASEADLLRSYPTLRAEDLTNTWAYARAHHDEIEQQILENETA